MKRVDFERVIVKMCKSEKYSTGDLETKQRLNFLFNKSNKLGLKKMSAYWNIVIYQVNQGNYNKGP